MALLNYNITISRPGYSRRIEEENFLNFKLKRDPHGDAGADFQLCDWLGQAPHMGDLLTVRDDDYGYVWSGYVAGPTFPGFFGGPLPVEARGWRHTIPDQTWDASKIWAEGTRLSDVVMEALTKCSHISGGVALPGGLSFQLAEDSQDFMLRSAEDVFNFVANKFKFLTTPLLWEVKQDQAHAQFNDPAFHMRFADLAPRYFVRLTEDDEFRPKYDRDTVYNQAAVGWSPKLTETYQEQNPSMLYAHIPHLRQKRVQASNELSTEQQAQQMGQYLVSRNNTMRPINTQLRINCNTPIRAIYPVVPVTDPDVPHYCVLSNYVIRIENDMSDWAPYNIRDYWISDVEYDFESGQLSLTLGDPIAYDDFALQQSYQTNRVSSSIDSGVVNEPLRDADVVPVFGPDKAGDTPPSIGEANYMAFLDPDGTLISLTNPDKPTVRHGAVVHPTLVMDYGVQVNFGREADSVGTKGFIQVIPCKVLAWDMAFTPPAGSDTVPTDSITVQLYPTYPFTVGVNVLATCIISSAQSATGTIAPSPASLAVFAQRGKIGVRVSSPGATSGSGFQIGVSGKKIFPDAGVTT